MTLVHRYRLLSTCIVPMMVPLLLYDRTTTVVWTYHYCCMDVPLLLSTCIVPMMVPLLLYERTTTVVWSTIIVVWTYHYCCQRALYQWMYHYCNMDVPLLLHGRTPIVIWTYHKCYQRASWWWWYRSLAHDKWNLNYSTVYLIFSTVSDSFLTMTHHHR